MKSSFYAIVCASCVLTISPGLQAEPNVPALDPGQHPETIRYESLFPDTIVPLDTELSWKNRFLGNESFNRDESLPSTGPELKSDAPDQADAAGDGVAAGAGVQEVVERRADQRVRAGTAVVGHDHQLGLDLRAADRAAAGHEAFDRTAVAVEPVEALLGPIQKPPLRSSTIA